MFDNHSHLWPTSLPNGKDIRTSMYVCICNALKHRQLSAAATDPAVETVPQLFRTCGARPKCGRCIDDVAELMSTVRQPARPALAAE